jgi:nitrilase
MIVDPWGRTLAERARGPGIAVATLDLEGQAALRIRFPALAHAHKVLEHG